MDLAFFDMQDEKYIGALFMIDIFTKFAVAIPFKTKQPHEILECIKEGISKMGGKPETFYTDNEGSFNSKEVQAYFKEHDIRWLSTNTHAGVVERLIRTIKNYIYKRAEHYKKPWWEYIYIYIYIPIHVNLQSQVGTLGDKTYSSRCSKTKE